MLSGFLPLGAAFFSYPSTVHLETMLDCPVDLSSSKVAGYAAISELEILLTYRRLARPKVTKKS